MAYECSSIILWRKQQKKIPSFLKTSTRNMVNVLQNEVPKCDTEFSSVEEFR